MANQLEQFLLRLESQYKSGNPDKYKQFLRAKRKLSLLMYFKAVKIYPFEQPTVRGVSIPLEVYTDERDKNLFYKNKYYYFRELSSIKINSRCHAQLYGCDIEYYIGGERYQVIHQALQRKGFFESSTDHSGSVLEHRPLPTDKMPTLIKEVQMYYTSLEKIIKNIKRSKEAMSLLFDTYSPPKIEFNYWVGCHLHLHIRRNWDNIKKALELLAVYHNSKRPELWRLRLQKGYGEPSDIRQSDWKTKCEKKTHLSYEVRAFNSGTPDEIAILFNAVDKIMKSNIIVPVEFYNTIIKRYSELKSNMKAIDVENYLTEVKIIEKQ